MPHPPSRAAPGGEAAIASLPCTVLLDGTLERFAGEIGTVGRQEDQLGIGCLPKEKVAQTHFAAGAYEEIGVRNSGGVETGRDRRLANQCGIELPCLSFRGDAADRADDLV